MAKYVQKNFIVDSSASFMKNTTFNGLTHVDSSLYVQGTEVGTMIYESSINYYDAATVDEKFTTAGDTTTIQFDSVDASIARLDASMNDVVDISEILDASLAEKVDKAGDTMTGELVLDAGLQLDSISITTIDTSAEGLSELDTAIPTSGAVKALVDSAISAGVTASNGLTETAGDIQLGGALTKNTTVDAGDFVFVIDASELEGSDYLHESQLKIDARGNQKLFKTISNPGVYNTNAEIDLGGGSLTLEGTVTTYTGLDFNTTGGSFDLQSSRSNFEFEKRTFISGGSNTYEYAYLRLDESESVFRNDFTSDGLKYFTDYSENFTARSLIDQGYMKAYVDGSISASSAEAWNGLTKTADGSIGLGGTLTSDTSISGGENYDLNIQDLTGFGVDTQGDISLAASVSGVTETVSTLILTDTISLVNAEDDNAGHFRAGSTWSNIGVTDANGETGLIVYTDTLGTYSDSPTFAGVQYHEDISGNYTNRSLIDQGYMKAYVDGSISASQTAPGNGLQILADGSIGLGGTLTETTTSISGDDISFNIFANNGGNSNFARLFISSEDNDGQIRLQYNDATGNTDSFIDLDSDGVQLKRNDIGTFSISGGGIVLTDSRTTKVGMEYAADYSANYTYRSLVDKEYVDTQISGGAAIAWNGLTKSVDGSIGLGGDLDKNTTIDGGSSYSFGLTNTSSFDLSSTDTGTKYTQVYGTNDTLALFHTQNGGDFVSINLGATGISLSDGIAEKGLIYSNDYDANGENDPNWVPSWRAVKGYVDGSIASNAFALTSGEGTTANGTSVDLGGVLSSDANIITGANKLFVTGEMNIVGNLIVDGSTTTVDSVNLDVSDNIITVNSGETGSGVSKGFAGLKVDRGVVDPYVFVFEESSATFRIGIGTEGGLPTGTQAVATRENAPVVNGIGFWNDTESRIDTSSGLVYTYGVGIEYEEDLHSSYTPRTLVDKSYVDTVTSGITAINGLTNTDGSIGLGGTLNSFTTISDDTGNYQLRINIGDGDLENKLWVRQSDIYISSQNGGNEDGTVVSLTDDILSLSYGDSGIGNTKLDINNHAISISSDSGSFAGITYTADVSSNYTNRSLVDKAYVDGQVSQAVSTGAFKYTGTFDGTADVSTLITAVTHELGTGPFMVSVYEDREEVITDISYETNGDIKIEWGSGTLNANCSYIIIG